MYLVLLTTIGATALVLLAMSWSPAGARLDAQLSAAQGQMQQYQAFLYASRRYFGQTAPPSVTTAYDWNTISSAAVPSMVQAGMPPHWKAVRRPDGYWVACTELAETTLAKLPALFPVPSQVPASGSANLLPLTVPAGSISVVVGNGGGSQPGTPSYVVLGQQGGVAAASANLCSGT